MRCVSRRLTLHTAGAAAQRTARWKSAEALRCAHLHAGSGCKVQLNLGRRPELVAQLRALLVGEGGHLALARKVKPAVLQLCSDRASQQEAHEERTSQSNCKNRATRLVLHVRSRRGQAEEEGALHARNGRAVLEGGEHA